jgi:hypothetical protein
MLENTMILEHKCAKLYCHMLVTRHEVWVAYWIYWTPITRNYKL